MSPPPPPPPPEKPQRGINLDEYNSGEDSDFDPASAPQPDDETFSDSDSEAGSGMPGQPKKRKRSSSPNFFDGGEGGFVKTRSQRAVEKREKLGGVKEGAVTTDVDRLWAEMNAAPVSKPPPASASASASPPAQQEVREGQAGAKAPEAEAPELSATGEKMVKIKTTYEFAGKTVTEEKLVPADSETARIYLSSASPTPSTPNDPSKPGRRPPPKKRASAFDAAAAARAKPAAPAKINTLEKSRMDWAGFVDKEGIGDELKKWNKGDKGYLDRQAFLGRVEDNRDRQWKEGKKT